MENIPILSMQTHSAISDIVIYHKEVKYKLPNHIVQNKS